MECIQVMQHRWTSSSYALMHDLDSSLCWYIIGWGTAHFLNKIIAALLKYSLWVTRCERVSHGHYWSSSSFKTIGVSQAGNPLVLLWTRKATNGTAAMSAQSIPTCDPPRNSWQRAFT